ncbi:biotin--[acetyl-CoA-carboxylase] ligase [Novosphingobium sp. Gsoil 351]|uniref:biotin--[acetyl-CoA-carboxylase] ligase n=1 Tax=Novosphingobium sp. Gsoil 351 TaxID=2675225 RepID=UPI0012B4581E|nr:biotin--[acetyl-CoA-carboxylase] ligase [Novosphingobium sp. Gsoil 351]QGN53919.1 biotin--[acetyl-CoA-carboxylase] ligase [Novosphingobium sp. Gsoil 351]
MIRILAETGSTNADLLALGRDAREGDWLVARRQRAGRGRAGREWEDGAGNFMGSTVVALRPNDPLPQTLALVTGLALAEAVAAVRGAPQTMLKWPNDLLAAGAKLAGILLERGGDVVVVGIGVNLVRAPELPDRATTALADHGARIDPCDFADLLADSFALVLARWRGGEWDALRAAWLARAHAIGTSLSVRDREGQPIAGTFAGLGIDGAALLRLADGTTRPIHAGDVELVGGDVTRG